MFPGQLLWSESPSRPLTGAEALIFQGFPALRFLKNVEATDQDQRGSKTYCSDSLMTDSAGNAMALRVLLAILQAGLACVCLNPEGDDTNARMMWVSWSLPWPRCCHDGCPLPGFAWFCHSSFWPLAWSWQHRWVSQPHRSMGGKRRWCFAFCMCVGNCMAWIEFAEKKLVVPHTLSVWAASKVNCELGKKSLV